MTTTDSTKRSMARGLGDMPKAGWVVILERAVQQFSHDDVTDRAAALTYFGLLALFPGMLVRRDATRTLDPCRHAHRLRLTVDHTQTVAGK